MSHQVEKTNAETEEAKRKAEEEWGHFGSWDFGILVTYCWTIILINTRHGLMAVIKNEGWAGKAFWLPGMGREIDNHIPVLREGNGN